MSDSLVDLKVTRKISSEMKRGTVSTGRGMRFIGDIPRPLVVEAWKQAGQVVGLLLDEIDRLKKESESR